ncbi:hypothetical protein SDC9_153254 [bioreactor metagenome]|uniref:Uncharacterized protein n=1 Tax=bioreactor metagenome TaxID=1076179 RepID=A0A645EX19_9ZZZZ
MHIVRGHQPGAVRLLGARGEPDRDPGRDSHGLGHQRHRRSEMDAVSATVVEQEVHQHLVAGALRRVQIVGEPSGIVQPVLQRQRLRAVALRAVGDLMGEVDDLGRHVVVQAGVIDAVRRRIRQFVGVGLGQQAVDRVRESGHGLIVAAPVDIEHGEGARIVAPRSIDIPAQREIGGREIVRLEIADRDLRGDRGLCATQ